MGAVLPNFYAFAMVLYAVTITHYLVAFVYSRRQISMIVRNPSSWAPALVCVALGPILYFLQLSATIFFGVHHVFNEVYLTRANEPAKQQSGSDKLLRRTALLLNMSIYLAVLRHDPALQWLNPKATFVVLAVTTGAMALILFKKRHEYTRAEMLQLCVAELWTLSLVPFANKLHINLFQVILYHVIFWTIYPVKAMLKGGLAPVLRYSAITVAFLAVSVAIAPFSGLPWRLSFTTYERLFWLLGYLHISTSFALSSAHPMFMRKLFQAGAKTATPLPRLETAKSTAGEHRETVLSK
jgi:hypothetical protein